MARGRRKATSAETADGQAADDAAPGGEPEAGESLRGMDRTFAVLERLADQPARAVDVTKDLNLPWATVYRTLMQLEKAQFLRRDASTGRYEIGPALWFIGTSYIANHRVLKAVLPHLHRAERLEGVAVQLSERIGRLSVNVYSAQPLAEDITKAHYGYHFPLHCGAKGKVLLAHSDPAFIESFLAGPLERLTDETVTDPEVLRGELAELRSAGYALTLGDVQPFTGSVAAPVRDETGTVVACVSFVVRRSMLRQEKRRDELVDELQRAAHAGSMDLGWRPGQAPA